MLFLLGARTLSDHLYQQIVLSLKVPLFQHPVYMTNARLFHSLSFYTLIAGGSGSDAWYLLRMESRPTGGLLESPWYMSL